MGGYTCFIGFAPWALRLWPSGGALFCTLFSGYGHMEQGGRGSKVLKYKCITSLVIIVFRSLFYSIEISSPSPTFLICIQYRKLLGSVAWKLGCGLIIKIIIIWHTYTTQPQGLHQPTP